MRDRILPRDVVCAQHRPLSRPMDAVFFQHHVRALCFVVGLDWFGGVSIGSQVRVDLDLRTISGLGLMWPTLPPSVTTPVPSYDDASLPTPTATAAGAADSATAAPPGRKRSSMFGGAAEWIDLLSRMSAPTNTSSSSLFGSSNSSAAATSDAGIDPAEADEIAELQIPVLRLPDAWAQRLAFRLRFDSSAVFQPQSPSPALRLATSGTIMRSCTAPLFCSCRCHCINGLCCCVFEQWRPHLRRGVRHALYGS